MVAQRGRIAPYLDAAPDKTLALVAEMDLDAPEGATEYFCPMHPEVVSVREQLDEVQEVRRRLDVWAAEAPRAR